MDEKKNEQVQIKVDPSVAVTIEVMKFDKKIAEAESVVADLKKQRAVYIYDMNIQALLAQYNQQQKVEPPPQV